MTDPAVSNQEPTGNRCHSVNGRVLDFRYGPGVIKLPFSVSCDREVGHKGKHRWSQRVFWSDDEAKS
jgi:hypothetical protein